MLDDLMLLRNAMSSTEEMARGSAMGELRFRTVTAGTAVQDRNAVAGEIPQQRRLTRKKKSFRARQL